MRNKNIRSWNLVDDRGARIYLPPPPPFLRTIVRVPIPFLRTEECFSGRPTCPHPTGPPGPGLPVGLLNASRSPFRAPPPPPYSLAMIFVGVR